jgi:hypothetical protein
MLPLPCRRINGVPVPRSTQWRRTPSTLMKRPRGGLRRSAFCASHRFKSAHATVATTTPAAIGKTVCAREVTARDLVSAKYTAYAFGECTTARAFRGCCTAGQPPVQSFVPQPSRTARGASTQLSGRVSVDLTAQLERRAIRLEKEGLLPGRLHRAKNPNSLVHNFVTIANGKRRGPAVGAPY